MTTLGGASARAAMLASAMAEVPDAAPGQLFAERFQVTRTLGAGTFGVVVEALDTTSGTPVAVKLLRPAWRQGDALARFLREAKILGELATPHVCRIVASGASAGGVPYLATELLSGRTLADELAARGALPVDEAARLMTQVCAALGEAHVRGIVHRDLKPENIFLCAAAGDEPLVKVLDFGVAKALADARLTQTGQEIGTPYYMAPEQLEGARDLSAAADVWAVGAVLHELVTGGPPFAGTTLAVVFTRILTGQREPIRDARAARAVGPIIDRCLAHAVSGRFASVAELAVALARVSADGSAPLLHGTGTGAAAATAPAMAMAATMPSGAGDAPPSSANPTVPAAEGNDQGSRDLESASAARRPRWPLLVAIVGGLTVAGIALAIGMARSRTPAPAPPAVASGSAAGIERLRVVDSLPETVLPKAQLITIAAAARTAAAALPAGERAGLAPSMELDACFDPSGAATSATVTSSAGSPSVDGAARTAALALRLSKPYLLDGVAAPVCLAHRAFLVGPGPVVADVGIGSGSGSGSSSGSGSGSGSAAERSSGRRGTSTGGKGAGDEAIGLGSIGGGRGDTPVGGGRRKLLSWNDAKANLRTVLPTELPAPVVRALDGQRPGRATIGFCVDAKGVTTAVNATSSSGNISLDRFLTELVRRWRFTPFRDGGAVIEVCSNWRFVPPAR